MSCGGGDNCLGSEGASALVLRLKRCEEEVARLQEELGSLQGTLIPDLYDQVDNLERKLRFSERMRDSEKTDYSLRVSELRIRNCMDRTEKLAVLDRIEDAYEEQRASLEEKADKLAYKVAVTCSSHEVRVAALRERVARWREIALEGDARRARDFDHCDVDI